MQENKTQRVAKNTGYMFFRMILVMLVGLYTSRVILEVLGFEDFGIYNVVGSVVIFLNFLKMALNNATYRYITYEIGSDNKSRLQEVYTMAINCHVVLAIVMLLIMEVGGVYFINMHLNISPDRMYAANVLFQFSLLTFAIEIINTPFNSNIIAHEEMNFYAMVSVIEVILKLLIVFALSWFSYDKLIFYGFLQMIVMLLITYFYIYYCKRQFKDCTYRKNYWNTKMAKDFGAYSGWSLLVNAADVIAYQCMSVFFNIFLGVISNAALGISNQVTNHTGKFLGSFTQAYQPQIIKSYASKDYNYFFKLLLSSSKISYYLMLFICVPLIVNIQFVLKTWLGSYPDMTPNLITLFLIYALVESTQSPLVYAVHANGHIRIHQIMMSTLKILAIISMYFVIKITKNGYLMIAIWLVFHFTWSLVRDVYLKNLINFPLKEFLYKVVLNILFITIISFPLPYLVVYYMGTSFLSFILSSSLFLIILSPVVWFFGLDKREKELIMEMSLVKNVTNYFSNKK